MNQTNQMKLSLEWAGVIMCYHRGTLLAFFAQRGAFVSALKTSRNKTLRIVFAVLWCACQSECLHLCIS